MKRHLIIFCFILSDIVNMIESPDFIFIVFFDTNILLYLPSAEFFMTASEQFSSIASIGMHFIPAWYVIYILLSSLLSRRVADSLV